jgi:pimeloyl-ACP methyl ester carboxylesterase
VSRLAAAVGVAALAIAIGAPVAHGQSPPAPSGVASSGDFAGKVAVYGGQRRMYLECHGTGSPTVIFEAGLRGRDDIWNYSTRGGFGTGVLPRVTPFTRICIYDRPGTLLGLDAVSRSDPVPMPRTTGSVVTDLHELLTVAGVAPPYVFVGSSTGGLIARRYTSIYPAEVSGLVLVDAISEAVQGRMTPGQFALYNQAYLQSPSPEAARYEDLEAIDFYGSFAEMRLKPRPPFWIPIVVLSSEYGFGIQGGVTPRFAHNVNRAWKRAQIYLASLQPGILRVIARGSGHQIALLEPGLVARMTLRVITAARGGKPLKPRRKKKHRRHRSS